ncbi:2-amino-4-hydroxy-6-hydroxymethyldihydropteridine diphosphokinase [Rhodoplanes serenus]|uniref:2-amino-4-hydroxy-6-hydroxymethyldihydropteridine pyrophosphokinase n=1 Tax=Rhodoplanes serenus TaxID=200615 RepID=A0A9X4XJ55_9BRAD|nr:2-amino-4-hydroxy-6-hydroxymethyldihydropteridine diphosphokinase [Rhodoplanes serenus]MTW15126.1 2-amino-4-hydroxy-6-hydroxymethyldihydropteridine diphosphokinase [Rhodoplanes serenus]
MAEAVLSLGGNVGSPRTTLARALALLCEDDAVRLVARSADYQTPPWGDTDQPSFVNLCAIVTTTLTPRALLSRARDVETRLGRDRARERRWGPRPVDIDIVSFADDGGREIAIDEPGLTLPHPRALERPFVLMPLAEIAPDRPVAGVRVGEALARLDSGGIVRLADPAGAGETEPITRNP